MSKTLLAVFAASILAPAAIAQPSGPPVKVSVSVPKGIVAGKEFIATVTVELPEGWHAYGPNPQRKKGDEELNTILGISMATNKAVDRFMPKPATPLAVPGKNAGEYIFEGTVKFPVTLRFKTGTKSASVTLNVTHQICDSSTCLPPKTETVKFVVNFAKKASK